MYNPQSTKLYQNMYNPQSTKLYQNTDYPQSSKLHQNKYNPQSTKSYQNSTIHYQPNYLKIRKIHNQPNYAKIVQSKTAQIIPKSFTSKVQAFKFGSTYRYTYPWFCPWLKNPRYPGTEGRFRTRSRCAGCGEETITASNSTSACSRN